MEAYPRKCYKMMSGDTETKRILNIFVKLLDFKGLGINTGK